MKTSITSVLPIPAVVSPFSPVFIREGWSSFRVPNTPKVVHFSKWYFEVKIATHLLSESTLLLYISTPVLYQKYTDSSSANLLKEQTEKTKQNHHTWRSYKERYIEDISSMLSKRV
jgi:hypothetical protein